MLQKVVIKKKQIKDYDSLTDSHILNWIYDLSKLLKGVKILEINSTSSGGGVAELLSSAVPLLQDLGINIQWQVASYDRHFFEITKKIHNALQGSASTLSNEEKNIYLEQNKKRAEMLEGNYDIIIVNDPQPAAMRPFANHIKGKWVWWCHIDTSEPNSSVWQFIKPYVEQYDAAVFTLPEFIPPDFVTKRIEFIAPAIDPLSPKNNFLPPELTNKILKDFNVKIDAPLLTQVSRFDPWKDPLGVIEVYRLVKTSGIKNLQLALIGSMAEDDPEAWSMHKDIVKEANHDPDIFFYTNLNGIGNLEVNAFQRGSNVVVQKSIREGFGLAVSEALWKKTPVVAGHTGGIPLQMSNGVGGFLIHTTKECAQKVSFLLQNPQEAALIAERGHKRVAAHFLITRFLAEFLLLVKTIIEEELEKAA